MSIATRPTTRRVTGPAPPVPRPAGPRAGDRALGASLRFAAFAALLLYGCEHWVRQVAPTATRVAFQMTGAGVGLALVLLALGRAPRRREPRGAVRIPARSAGADANAARGAARAVVIVVAVLATTLLALGAAGIPLRFVGWHHWSELGTGVKEGLSALPNLNIPYRGLDLWVRWTVQAGAALLVVMAAVLAFGGRAASDARPRRRIAAALVLATLYAVPVIERNPDSPFLSGTGFAALLALFLAADRLAGIGGARPRLLAVGAGGLALLLAALIAPRLDGGSSWVDYRGLADDLAQRNTDVFDWNHSYTPLKWPRDGRELLRITAKQPSYWKAENLTRFDGKRWVSEVNTDPTGLDSPRPNDEPSWYEDIKVTVRNLRSEQYVGAGYTSDVKGVSRPATAAGSGTFTVSGKALKPGDTYTASVYTPRPSVRQMRAASTDYPDYVLRDLTMELPKSVGGPSPGQPRPDGAQVTTLLFPAFGSTTPITTYIPGATPTSAAAT